MTIHVAILTAVGSAKSRAGAFDSAMSPAISSVLDLDAQHADSGVARKLYP